MEPFYFHSIENISQPKKIKHRTVLVTFISKIQVDLFSTCAASFFLVLYLALRRFVHRYNLMLTRLPPAMQACVDPDPTPEGPIWDWIGTQNRR